MAKVLVVYFSRSGTTRSAAERVAHALNADVEEIVESGDRAGIFGYLRSGFEATFLRRPRIAPPRFDPASYDLVVIGTPIWNASLASPVRSYLAANHWRIGRLALLATCGGSGMAHVSRQVEKIAGRRACAEIAITDDDRARGRDAIKIERFVQSLRFLAPSAALQSVA